VSGTFLVVAFISTIAATWAGGAIGRRKDRQTAGIVLGLLLGWLGVIIICFVGPTRRERDRRAAAATRGWGR
jgi:hypothetical protein